MTESNLEFLNKNLPIFITHYTKLTERKKFITEQLNKHNIKATFINDFDKENLTHNDKAIFDESKLKIEEISLMCKHFYIYKHIIENNISHAIIFEDDVFLYDDFVNKIVSYFKQLPQDWDFLFFGSGWNLHVPESVMKNNTNVYLKNNNGVGKSSPEHKEHGWPICAGSTRCMDSYIINQKFIKKFFWYNNFSKSKIWKPLDIHLNILFRDTNANVYWGEPTLTKQNNFPSSIK